VTADHPTRSPDSPTCDMDDGGKPCGQHYGENGCSIHARASQHRGHRIVVNGHDNRWCHDCDQWVDFDPARPTRSPDSPDPWPHHIHVVARIGDMEPQDCPEYPRCLAPRSPDSVRTIRKVLPPDRVKQRDDPHFLDKIAMPSDSVRTPREAWIAGYYTGRADREERRGVVDVGKLADLYAPDSVRTPDLDVSSERIRHYMAIWDRLAQGDRDTLKEHYPDDAKQIGYYDGYATAARDVLSFLDRGRFALDDASLHPASPPQEGQE
jgi:hypothetical protein